MFVRAVTLAATLAMSCARNPAMTKETQVTRERLAGPTGALHVDDGGAGGLPVIFVHAFAGDAAQWSAQLQHLRRTRRAVALDLRGHGRSAPPANGDYRVEASIRTSPRMRQLRRL
jgi:pimeloyl-ACP methyl ester carboxylesterase